MSDRRRTRRFGLRARVIGAFGLSALVLSVLLSVVTYTFTRQNLLDKREQVAMDSVTFNARQANVRLVGNSEPQQIQDFLGTLVTPEDSGQGVLFEREYYFVNAVSFARTDINPQLLERIEADVPARMRYRVNDQPFLVVGIPLPEPGGVYIEARSLTDVESTLNSLRLALLGASALTTVAGFALGYYVSRRLFQPLADASLAAAMIAGGDLSTRLPEETDPDLQMMSRSFNDMATALEQRIERDARFASEVSHELRSPLMTLTASAAVLLKRRDELPERAQVAVDLLSSDITRFRQLVEDLLEISRFDVGAAELETEPLRVDEFIQQAVALAGRLDVPVIASPATEGLLVSADKRRLAQVVRNLLDNAEKYGGGASAIKLTRSDDRVVIAVEDNGPGVPVAERKVIFDRFSRGSEGGRRGSGTGVGLGLSLVTEHLRLHRGEIWVEDRADGKPGARFVVSLPGVIE